MTNNTECSYCKNKHERVHEVVCPVKLNPLDLPLSQKSESFFSLEIFFSNNQQSITTEETEVKRERLKQITDIALSVPIHVRNSGPLWKGNRLKKKIKEKYERAEANRKLKALITIKATFKNGK